MVLLALNLSIQDAGNLLMVQQVSLMMSYLTIVDYPVSFLLSRGDHSKMLLLFEFCCGAPPSWLKVRGWSNLVSAPVPFGFRSYWDLLGLGLGGFGTKVWGQGLTILANWAQSDGVT